MFIYLYENLFALSKNLQMTCLKSYSCFVDIFSHFINNKTFFSNTFSTSYKLVPIGPIDVDLLGPTQIKHLLLLLLLQLVIVVVFKSVLFSLKFFLQQVVNEINE